MNHEISIIFLLKCFFQVLFNNILLTPFETPCDDGSDLTQTFFNPEKEGYLTKEGIILFVIFTSLLISSCHCC